jgi:hypothetical protein
MKEDNVADQVLNKELLDGKIEGLDASISDLEEMLETDDSIPAAAM